MGNIILDKVMDSNCWMDIPTNFAQGTFFSVIRDWKDYVFFYYAIFNKFSPTWHTTKVRGYRSLFYVFNSFAEKIDRSLNYFRPFTKLELKITVTTKTEPLSMSCKLHRCVTTEFITVTS